MKDVPPCVNELIQAVSEAVTQPILADRKRRNLGRPNDVEIEHLGVAIIVVATATVISAMLHFPRWSAAEAEAAGEWLDSEITKVKEFGNS